MKMKTKIKGEYHADEIKIIGGYHMYNVTLDAVTDDNNRIMHLNVYKADGTRYNIPITSVILIINVTTSKLHSNSRKANGNKKKKRR